MGLTLVGPFEVLSGRFDGRSPRLSPLLHWRYYLDPPEFSTVLAGAVDRFHYGYYLDNPGDGRSCVASCTRLTLSSCRPTATISFRRSKWKSEVHHRDCEDYLAEDRDRAAEYKARLTQLEIFRRVIREYGTQDRFDSAAAYFEKYRSATARTALVIASTPEYMGVVAPQETYRPLSLSDKKLRSLLYKQDDPVALVVEV